MILRKNALNCVYTKMRVADDLCTVTPLEKDGNFFVNINLCSAFCDSKFFFHNSAINYYLQTTTMGFGVARCFSKREQKFIEQLVKDEDFDIGKTIDKWEPELRESRYFGLLENTVRWTPYESLRTRMK